jgi:hypothetical protein
MFKRIFSARSQQSKQSKQPEIQYGRRQDSVECRIAAERLWRAETAYHKQPNAFTINDLHDIVPTWESACGGKFVPFKQRGGKRKRSSRLRRKHTNRRYKSKSKSKSKRHSKSRHRRSKH